ncbi:hypothetical protein MB02_05560 [Croceicoccus estronivorus]|uniref:phosphatase PAP2 family protein n=1 Tax=Croceicoccus estronivorus TaxID=1172626 RepID=UPI000835DFF6|nr:phosphatase PAP2 family protein [Croceicoccus estronivorus]OCC24919.1 hypothetical protein MB02_05560 [Croceicoccus estronivorus]
MALRIEQTAATGAADQTATGGWRRQIRDDLPIFALFSLIALISAILVAREGSAFTSSTLIANLDLYPKAIGFALAVETVIILSIVRPHSPLSFLSKRYTSPDMRSWIAGRMPSFMILSLFLPLFAVLKPMIPVLNPYAWDAQFIRWDAILFGDDPWRLMQPLLGYPIITSGLSVIYHAWFLLVFPFALLMLFSHHADRIRRRYLMAYLSVWTIVGFGLATAFSSVGPCFLQPLTGNGHFAEQMAYLNHANQVYPVLVLDVQKALLDIYTAEGPGHGAGITAMPSMHVALAFLSYLAVRHVSKWAGRFFLAFFVLIWIGSVHLAYHYAVDGLVSVIAVAAIWKLTDLIFKWWDRQAVTSPATDAIPATA